MENILTSEKTKTEVYEEAFNNFLADNGIYDLFSEYKDREVSEARYFSEYIGGEEYNILPVTWVSGTFSWTDTKEGYIFWSNINGMWLNTLNEIII